MVWLYNHILEPLRIAKNLLKHLKTISLKKNICPFKGETSSRNINYCFLLLLLLFVVCKGETELDLVELPQAEYQQEEKTGQVTARSDFD